MQSNVHNYKLDFTPDVTLHKSVDVAGEDICIEIVTQFQPNRHWALFINNVIEGCSNNHGQYVNLMLTTANNITNDQNVLIVGGGDLRLAEAINDMTPLITVVDPLSINIQRMLGMIAQQIDLTQFSSLTIEELLFSHFILEHNPKEYQHVFVDVSENTMEATREIYCDCFFHQLSTLISRGGYVHMYFGYNPEYFVRNSHNLGFKHVHTKQRYFDTYCDYGYCLTLQKR